MLFRGNEHCHRGVECVGPANKALHQGRSRQLVCVAVTVRSTPYEGCLKPDTEASARHFTESRQTSSHRCGRAKGLPRPGLRDRSDPSYDPRHHPLGVGSVLFHLLRHISRLSTPHKRHSYRLWRLWHQYQYPREPQRFQGLHEIRWWDRI